MNSFDLLREVSRHVRAELERGRRAQPRTRLAVVNPAHAGGRPRVTFDGETTLSTKTYAYLSSYTPTANDRVLLVPSGTSYVIVGKVV